MHAFDYVPAHHVDEAVALLVENGDNARVLSGGTDLLVQMKEGRRHPGVVVDIKPIPELNELLYDPVEGLWLGACVPCHRLNHSRAIHHAFPGLIDSSSLIGGIQIQGRASLGGNLCNASPAADAIPSLIVHNAICHIAGPAGRRQVPVETFCTGPGQTVLQPGEFLVSLQLPAPRRGFGAAYLRFIPRNEMDIAVVGAGASVQLDPDGDTIRSAHVALGAVAPIPLLVEEAGAALIGRSASDANAVEEAARLAQAAARPIDDVRGTIAQRKHLSAVLTRRALNIAIGRARTAMQERTNGRA